MDFDVLHKDVTFHLFWGSNVASKDFKRRLRLMSFQRMKSFLDLP